MSAPINNGSKEKKTNEWTVMFFFASDNELSPLVVSQLKAIKDAGFQKNTDVLVYFDANEKGAPTSLYHVNHTRKTREPDKSKIGDGEDPYVRNLDQDSIDPKDLANTGKHFKDLMSKSLDRSKPDGTNSLDALKNFIGYGRENHKAKHYILFLVGHGMIVANDAFLPDETPKSAITLKALGEALHGFSDSMEAEKEAFELLALHSCSMSAVEVAYELKGTAKYMMASEGISFVGSFPYRQLLKKIFKTIETDQEDAKPVDVETLLQKLYFLALYNSTDFMLNGYSSELSLCSLDPAKLKDLGKQLVTLVTELKKGLDNDEARELILLAHWKSQSYWNESYTDLYDFCQCLERGCRRREKRYGNDALLTSISNACGAVIEKLEKDRSSAFSKLVVFSEHFGSKYQYSHGLSVYFPWAKPIADSNEKLIENYREYLFTKDFKADETDPKADKWDDSWLSFLEAYFTKTMRKERTAEDKKTQDTNDNPDPKTLAADPALVTSAAATSSTVGALERKASGAFERKASGAAGADCSCPSIKNYPHFSISRGAALAFEPDSDVPLPE